MMPAGSAIFHGTGCVAWFGLREQVKRIRRVQQAEEQFINRGRAEIRIGVVRFRQRSETLSHVRIFDLDDQTAQTADRLLHDRIATDIDDSVADSKQVGRLRRDGYACDWYACNGRDDGLL